MNSQKTEGSLICGLLEGRHAELETDARDGLVDVRISVPHQMIRHMFDMVCFVLSKRA